MTIIPTKVVLLAEDPPTLIDLATSIKNNVRGVITVDEWLKFSMKYTITEAATLAAHLVLDHVNLVKL